MHRSNLVNKNVIFKKQHTPLGLDRSTVLDLQAAGSRQIAIMRKEAKKAMKTNVDGHSYQQLDAVFLKGSGTHQVILVSKWFFVQLHTESVGK